MNKGATDYAIAATFVVVTMDTCKDQGTLEVNFDVLNAFLLYMMGDYAKTGKSLRSLNYLPLIKRNIIHGPFKVNRSLPSPLFPENTK